MPYPTIPPAAGTLIHVSTEIPATHDATGFGAIVEADWDEIGFVMSSGGLPRAVRSFSDVDFLDGSAFPVVGPARMAELQIQVALAESIAGHLTVEANSDGSTKLSFRWSLVGGIKVYAVCFATGYAPTIGDFNTQPVMADFTIKPLFDDNRVGPVLVRP